MFEHYDPEGTLLIDAESTSVEENTALLTVMEASSFPFKFVLCDEIVETTLRLNPDGKLILGSVAIKKFISSYDGVEIS